MEKELLYRFFAGEATAEDETRLLDWLDEDPAHQREMLAERRLFDAMLMHAQPARSSVSRRFSLPRWSREVLRYAAVLIVAVGAGAFYFSGLQKQLMQSYNSIVVPAGQHVDITLPDGTKVCMNALSELRYPAFFAGKERKVQLEGEAFFDVKHDAKHPFIVETYACDVEVLGTKFDVEARTAADEFTASLVVGSVRVTDRNKAVSDVVLKPRQQVSRRDGRLVVTPIAEHEEFLWREGLISFRDASFDELLSEFEKYYGLNIEVRRSPATETLFTGKIRISEGIDHALWVLQQSAAFTYTRNDTKETIYIQ